MKKDTHELLIDVEDYPTPHREPPPKKDDRGGHVYLVYSPVFHYKIGAAKYLNTRIKALKKHYGKKWGIELIHSIETNDRYRTERRLHALFQDKHIKGDWFYLDEDDVSRIKSFARANCEGNEATITFTKLGEAE